MPPPSPLPTYVYKILPSAPPSPLPSHLPLSDLDAKDGFIHLSTAQQTPRTVGRFFSTTKELWLLKIPLDRIEKCTKWEDGGSDCFPHIYGPMVGRDEVADAKAFERSEGEGWKKLLEKDPWLA